MSTSDRDDSRCALDVTLIYAGLEVWLRQNIDPTAQNRDQALAEILATLLLHAARLRDHDVATTPETLTAEAHLLPVLDWLAIATNDLHDLLHLAIACTLHAHDITTLTVTAWSTARSLRCGTAPGCRRTTTHPLQVHQSTPLNSGDRDRTAAIASWRTPCTERSSS